MTFSDGKGASSRSRLRSRASTCLAIARREKSLTGFLNLRRYFRADAAFANPEIYEFLEAEGYKYTIRLPANRILQERIGDLLKRHVGRPPITIRPYYASFSYQAQS